LTDAPKALLFDFDGTLVDSESLHYESWLHAVEPYGASTDWADYQKRFVGQTGKWAARTFFEEAGVDYDADLVAKATSAKQTYFRKHAGTRLIIACDVILSISQLPFYLLLGIVSSSHRQDIEPTLVASGLLDRMTVLVCGNNVTRHKPDPEPYLIGLERLRAKSGQLGLTAADVLVYEDSRSGIASGRAAGMVVRRVEGPHMVPIMLAEEAWS
jgi:beta-phosphoglucomutase